MPQNAIIRADGTGDYTTPQAWEAAEQSSNYGSITVGRVDGFFDSGSSQLDINGSWPNGARLEAFSSTGAFDGTERQLCGMTSTGITVRGRGNKTELFGLEIYSTTTQGAYIATTSGGDTNISSCLLRANSGTSRLNSLVGNGYVNCVLASNSDTVFNGDTVGTGNSIFANESSSVGSTDTITLSNTAVYNDNVGACFRDTVTQSNNASTDATADTLTNIVVADNFVSTTPLTSGDYRIKSGSLLDTNGIGAFVQSSGGLVITTSPIASAESFGSPTITTGVVLISPIAIATQESVGSPAILPELFIGPSAITSLEFVGNPIIELILQQIFPNGIPTEEFVGRPLVLGGASIVIPVDSRQTWNAVAQYLRNLVFRGQDNDVIVAWLRSEGFEEGAYNDMWYDYLFQSGFLDGSLTDKYAAWRQNVLQDDPWLLSSGSWNDFKIWRDNENWRDS